MWNPYNKYIPITKIFKDISCQEDFLLQFLSPVMHQHVTSTENFSNTNQIVSLLDSNTSGIFTDHRMQSELHARPFTVQPGLSSQNPLQVLPVNIHLLPLTSVLQSTRLFPQLCVSEYSFSLCEILYFHPLLPGSWTTFTQHLRHHITFFSSRLPWYPQAECLISFCATSPHTFFWSSLQHFHKIIKFYFSLPEFSLYKYLLFIFAKIPTLKRTTTMNLHVYQWKYLSCPWILQEGIMCKMQALLCCSFGLTLVLPLLTYKQWIGVKFITTFPPYFLLDL